MEARIASHDVIEEEMMMDWDPGSSDKQGNPLNNCDQFRHSIAQTPNSERAPHSRRKVPKEQA